MSEQEKNPLFFGQFLLERGVITNEALEDALAFQRESNRRIGEMAMEKSYLTPEQVDRIFAEQQVRDEPFGVIALQMRYLSRKQLDDLLFTQTIYSTHLGEAMLMRGHITSEQFVEYLKQYNEMTKVREAELDSLLQGLPDQIVFQAAVKALDGAFTRFVGKHARIGRLRPAPPVIANCSAYALEAPLLDNGRILCLVGLADEVALIIAERLSQTLDSCDAPLQNPAVHCQEFFNIMARYFGQALEDVGFVLSAPPSAVVTSLDAWSAPVVEMVTPAGAMFFTARLEA
jgi:hypothetical protein